MFYRTKNLNLSPIKKIELEASRFADVISLAQGIPSFDTPRCIKQRVVNALNRGAASKYSLSPGLPELRELIEIRLARENMFYDWEKEIIVTAGSIEGITAAILAITQPGDEIIITEPTYTSYREVIALAGAVPAYAALDESRNWSFDLDAIRKAVTPKTRAIFFCNPSNPTGTIFSKQDQMALAQIAAEHDLYIITDEVYKDFVYGGEKIFSLAEVPELRERVIRVYSFSKAYAMTGWRIGYIHSSERIISEILKIHDCLVTCAPVISQYAAMGALEMGDRDVEAFNREYKARRDLVCGRLDRLSDHFEYIRPQSSYYAFPRYKREDIDSWSFAYELIAKARVAVVPGSAFGPSGENHIRISFGRSMEDINEAFGRLEKFYRI